MPNLENFDTKWQQHSSFAFEYGLDMFHDWLAEIAVVEGIRQWMRANLGFSLNGEHVCYAAMCKYRMRG